MQINSRFCLWLVVRMPFLWVYRYNKPEVFDQSDHAYYLSYFIKENNFNWDFHIGWDFAFDFEKVNLFWLGNAQQQFVVKCKLDHAFKIIFNRYMKMYFACVLQEPMLIIRLFVKGGQRCSRCRQVLFIMLQKHWIKQTIS